MCTVQIIHDTYPIYRPFGDYSGEFKVWTMFDFCTCLLYWISGHMSIFMIPKTLDSSTTKWPYSSCPVYVQCTRPFVNICFVVYDFQICVNTTNLPATLPGTKARKRASAFGAYPPMLYVEWLVLQNESMLNPMLVNMNFLIWLQNN